MGGPRAGSQYVILSISNFLYVGRQAITHRVFKLKVLIRSSGIITCRVKVRRPDVDLQQTHHLRDGLIKIELVLYRPPMFDIFLPVGLIGGETI